MKYSALSDKGLFRDTNQDSYFASVNKDGAFLAFVADGVGGGKAGDVASQMVVSYFNEHFLNSEGINTKPEVNEYLLNSIEEINNLIYEKAKTDIKYTGMCTTISGIFATDKYICSFNVGDSRVYGVLPNKLEKLTVDDSYINELIERGQITLEEAKNHPRKNVLTKALGSSFVIEPKIFEIGSYDYYMICSDGLYGLIDESLILEVILNDKEELAMKTSELVSLALLNGGFDNITVVLCK